MNAPPDNATHHLPMDYDRLIAENATLHNQNQALQEQNQALQQQLAALARERDAAYAAEHSLRNLLMQAPAAIAVLEGPDLMLTFANPLNLRLLGKPPEQILGKSLRETFQEPAYAAFIALLDQVYTTGTAYKGVSNAPLDRHGTGQFEETWFEFIYHPILTPEGTTSSIFMHAVDITEQVRARQEAEQLSAVLEQRVTERTAELARQADDLRLFQTLVETITDAVVVAGLDGHIIYGNPAYYRQFRFIPDQSGNLRDTIVPEARSHLQQDILPQLLERGAWRGKMLHCRVDGSRFPGDDLSVVIRTASGEVTYIASVVRDMTMQVAQEQERELLQRQVIEAQRDALRELSTPLIPITEEVLIMPLIGTIDSYRAQLVMETLLAGVAQQQANLVILDITGVRVVDTQVAQAFIRAAQAVRLLGAQVMLTGIGPQVAQTLVHLGVDLSGMLTRGTLQAGIGEALRRNGMAKGDAA